MNYFKILFTTALVVGIISLATVYIIGHTPNPRREILWQESLQHINEICRLKHYEYRNYAIYARRAEKDSLLNLATLLRAMSSASEVQYHNCRKAIKSLGGVFYIPNFEDNNKPISDTLLRHAINHKLHHHNSTTRNGIKQAIADGNRYIARMLTWCDASETKMIMILQREIAADSFSHSTYRICPTCGAISDEILLPCFCPHCMTSSEEFLIFE